MFGKPILIFLVLIASAGNIKAQTKTNGVKSSTHQKACFGLGFGLDYGGFGMRAQFLPAKNLGVFGGFGYNMVEIAYNAGLIVKPVPGKRIQPVFLAMYGYNAALKVKYGFGGDFARSYYGLTVGAGCEIMNQKNHVWSLELLVPFRNSKFDEQYNSFKDAGVQFSPGILPLAFTVGYNFAVKPGRK